MKFEVLPPISHDQLERSLAGEADEAARGLLRMSLNDDDWSWAERKCLTALLDEREIVRAAAITGLANLARIHHKVTKALVVPELEKLKGDPQLGGRAEDALEDISKFASQSKSERKESTP